jgi:hypothetical protein
VQLHLRGNGYTYVVKLQLHLLDTFTFMRYRYIRLMIPTGYSYTSLKLLTERSPAPTGDVTVRFTSGFELYTVGKVYEKSDPDSDPNRKKVWIRNTT